MEPYEKWKPPRNPTVIEDILWGLGFVACLILLVIAEWIEEHVYGIKPRKLVPWPEDPTRVR